MSEQELTAEELEARVSAEMIELHKAGAGVRLDIPPFVAFTVVSMMQLALRHPDIDPGEPRDAALQFIEQMRQKFERANSPAIAEAIRRGNEPEHDTPNEAEEERALLSRLLNSRDPLENARLVFTHEKHRMIFQRIMDLHERGEPVDRVSLANELMKNGELQAVGGLAYLVTLYDKKPATPEEILEQLSKQSADKSRVILTCPFCGYAQMAPESLAKIDLYICAGCGRTVETE
jgi:hypothetical protein